MICQQVTLSGDAEWPKVADAMIEAAISPPNNSMLTIDVHRQHTLLIPVNLVGMTWIYVICKPLFLQR